MTQRQLVSSGSYLEPIIGFSRAVRVGNLVSVGGKPGTATDAYAGQKEADVEDILGAQLYVELVNACYALKGKQAVVVPPETGGRIVKHVDEHFRTLLPPTPEFDHYTPSMYLTEHRSAMLKKLADADLEAALVRFEKLFVELNALLPSS